MRPVTSIQPHLCVKGAKAALDFYQKAFGAVASRIMPAQDGQRLLHARMNVFGGEVLLHDEFPECSEALLSPLTLGGASVSINVDLSDPDAVDQAYTRAVSAGADPVMPPADMFWGARYGRLRDPFGHIWSFQALLSSPSSSV